MGNDPGFGCLTAGEFVSPLISVPVIFSKGIKTKHYILQPQN